MATADTIAALQGRFPELALEPRPLMKHLDGRESGQLWVRVPPERMIEFFEFARDDARTKFEQLCDLTCVDYLNFSDPPSDERFGMVYSLLSITHNHRLWVRVFLSDPDPSLPSVYPIWHGADWMEREVFDLFGIKFEGHPDLRPIVLPEMFTDSPLRKDYPLRGKGERESLPVIDRETA